MSRIYRNQETIGFRNTAEKPLKVYIYMAKQICFSLNCIIRPCDTGALILQMLQSISPNNDAY